MTGTPTTPPPFVVWLDHVGADGFAHLADELWAEVSELHSGPPGTREALRASVVSHLPHLRAWFLGEHDKPSLPSAAYDFVEQMALAEAPLSAILRSYELGHASIWNGYVRFLRGSTLPYDRRADALEAGSVRMFKYMQAMTSEAVMAFNQVRMSVTQEYESRRGEIVKGVLAGTVDAADLRDLLGYRADDVHIGYTAWSTGDGIAGQVGEALRRRLVGLATQHLAVPAGVSSVHGWFTPNSASSYERLRDIELPPGVGAAFGSARTGIDGFRHTHDEALLSMRVPSPPDRVVYFPDAAVEILVSQRGDLARRFVEDQLGPVLQHESRDRLLLTMRHFLETSGSPSRSGRRLGVHANTVTQRIRRIEGILGRPIDLDDLSIRVALAVEPVLSSDTREAKSPPESCRPSDGRDPQGTS